MAYKTKQKNFVLDCFKKHEDESITAQKLMEYLREQNISVGMATIYRHLSKLTDDGMIRKFTNDEGESATYRYSDKKRDCKNHFHLVCNGCGKLIHLECANLSSLYSHILSEHNFKVDTEKTVFYGTCTECKN